MADQKLAKPLIINNILSKGAIDFAAVNPSSAATAGAPESFIAQNK
ncbi:MAG: hypothetical protein AB1745_27965 [Pseudomonadota bacterium]|jgi:hypothetical protein